MIRPRICKCKLVPSVDVSFDLSSRVLGCQGLTEVIAEVE